MTQKQFLLKGTFLLTAAGAAARILGFFYRIFLSRTIGAEGIGIFHLTMPIYAFCMAAASGGIQTAISRYCAEDFARKDKRSADRVLFAGLLVSLSLSALTAALVYWKAGWIAERFLAEKRCAVLLRILSFSLPFSVLHTCLSGYFIGRKQVKIPATAQILEQLFRIGSAFVFCHLMTADGQELSVSVMALGQAAGELCSAAYCTVCCLLLPQDGAGAGTENRDALSSDRPSARKQSSGKSVRTPGKRGILQECRKITAVSAPLSANRMLLCVLQGIEAALLPQQLMRSGLGSSAALSMYGTLTGMTMPLLLFPTAITGALGTLLLPAVSEARVLDRKRQLAKTIEISFRVSLTLGVFCSSLFCLFGRNLGNLLFRSSLSGSFILDLAWLCPFLYLNTTLSSVLHGLGKTAAVSLQNSIGFAVRLAAVALLVPAYGIRGYFTGLFASQFLIFAAALITLHRSAPLQLPVFSVFGQPLLLCTAGAGVLLLLRNLLPVLRDGSWTALLLGGGIYLGVLAVLGLRSVCGSFPSCPHRGQYHE